MAVATNDEIKEHAVSFGYALGSVIGQTLVYGAYAAYAPYGLKVIFQKKPRGALSAIMSYLPILSFVISTLFCCATTAALFVRLHIDFVNLTSQFGVGFSGNLVEMQNLFNACAILNFVVTDAIVLWRAWVICSESRLARIVLQIDTACLCLTLVSCFSLIILRVIEFHCNVEGFGKFGSGGHSCRPVTAALIDSIQASVMGISLFTNMIATGTIAQRLWTFRKATVDLQRMNDPEKHGGAVNKTFKTLIEGGFLYGVLGVLLIVSTRIPSGDNRKLGSTFFPLAVQLCGLYPMLVLVSIHKGSSSNPRPGPAETVAWLPNSLPNIVVPVSWAKVLTSEGHETSSSNHPISRSHTHTPVESQREDNSNVMC